MQSAGNQRTLGKNLHEAGCTNGNESGVLATAQRRNAFSLPQRRNFLCCAKLPKEAENKKNTHELSIHKQG